MTSVIDVTQDIATAITAGVQKTLVCDRELGKSVVMNGDTLLTLGESKEISKGYLLKTSGQHKITMGAIDRLGWTGPYYAQSVLSVGTVPPPVKKRLKLSPYPEAGIHAHNLFREDKRTWRDGVHVHLFQMPDGMQLTTEEDGIHAHGLKSNTADKTRNGGEHSHVVIMPDGTKLETAMDGTHRHDLQVNTTGFDGTHDHVLELDEETRVRSVMPGEFWLSSGKPSQDRLRPIASSTILAKAISKPTKIVKLSSSNAVDLPGFLEPISQASGFDISKNNPFTKDGEQRMVLGIELEPETFDAQGEIYDEHTIRQAAKSAGSTIGEMHEKEADGAMLMGVYIASKTFAIDNEPVKKGTLISLIHVFGDDPWSKVVSGEYGGLSIGGHAKKEPLQ